MGTTQGKRALLVAVLFVAVFATGAYAQGPVSIRYVDIVTGQDSAMRSGQTPLSAWKTVRFALVQTSSISNGSVIIRVIGKMQNGVPVRHTDADEHFPLVVPQYRKIEKDTTYSQGPVIFDGSGMTTLDAMFLFGADGNAAGASTGLKGVHVYDCPGDTVYPDLSLGAVHVESTSNNQALNPRFESVTFNRCFVGVKLKVARDDSEVSPTITSCLFENQADGWDGTGPGTLYAHVDIYTDGYHRKTSPLITDSSFLGNTVTGKVRFGIQVRAFQLPSSEASPTIENCTIGYSISTPAPPNPGNGLGTGVHIQAGGVGKQGGKADAKVRNSLIQGCYAHGIAMASQSASTVSQPQVYNCRVNKNGRAYGATMRVRTDQVQDLEGHGIVCFCSWQGILMPTISRGGSGVSEVKDNKRDGISLITSGYQVLPYQMKAEVKETTIENNLRYGLFHWAFYGKSYVKATHNRIFNNDRGGVVNAAWIPEFPPTPITPTKAQATLINNTIFSGLVSPTQAFGVVNERFRLTNQNLAIYCKATLYEIHDTVAQHDRNGSAFGIRNYDSVVYTDPSIPKNKESKVWNTISFYNQGDHNIEGLNYQTPISNATTQVIFSDFTIPSGGGNSHYTNNNVDKAPVFVNRAAYDFHLTKPTSPLTGSHYVVDKAANAPPAGWPPISVTNDFDFEARPVDLPTVSNVTANDWADMGADEVQP